RRKGLAVPGRASAPLIAILGPKGGTGKTLISANLAVALAQRDANVVLVDLDLQFGDIGLALGLSPERTMYDLMKTGPPFDHETLDLMGYETDHVSLVLNRADSLVGITPDDVSTIIGRGPDVSIPSDREIPRSINEGTPIVAAKPHSGAAKAFRALADRYAKTP